MPIIATSRHALPYVSRSDEQSRLADVEVLIRALQRVSVNPRVQKMMLDRTIWLVVELTGNFYSRYRSLGAISQPGERIQRDHIFTRKSLVSELQEGTADVRSVIDRAQCCIVTHAEHVALSKVPKHVQGWDRYRKADPIVRVRNMETGESMV